jgi:hypothetical protein
MRPGQDVLMPRRMNSERPPVVVPLLGERRPSGDVGGCLIVSALNDARGRWYKGRELELRGLIWEWDPLGLMGVSENEYDSLIDGTLSALVNHGDDSEVVAAIVRGLDYMAGEGYSAASATRHSQPDALDPFIARLRTWWEDVPASP